jgi:hypothetical protein
MPEDGSLTSQVTIWTVLDRRKFGWYCADLHHHTNLVDGATHPRDSVLSQSAAGLDFVTVSDHDTVANHKDMQTFWAARSLPHNPGIVSQSTNPDQIFAAAKKAGAYIQVNHPMEEGNAYFRSIDAGTVPGLVRMDFDFVEINGDGHFDESDQATLAKVYGFWNIGKHYCLTGGSDTHDVHSPAPDEVSGRARTCVWMGNETGSVAALMSGMKAGRSFVTLGPLLLADPIPGEGQLAAGKEATIKVQLYARHGLVSVALIKDGDTLDLHLYKDHPGKADHAFTFTPEPGSWYHIIAIDQAGNPALTNPYWVKDRGRGVKI